MGKRKIGDRRDGKLLRNIDGMHFIMPLIFPNRCDNEAFISERIDLTNINEYLAKKNADNPEYKYNLFQVIVTAVLKTVTLRPYLNRFVANGSLYQRNKISAAFTIKKIFTDESAEALAFIYAKDEHTIEDVHNEIFRQVSHVRKSEDSKDPTSEFMDMFSRLPRFISKPAVKFCCFLERHGKIPQALIATDPYYSSVLLTNLGSIKLKSGYHHLSNWGTTSMFAVIGEKKIRPFFNEDGTFAMKDSVDLGLTVDERIADGYYFSKSVKLLKKLLENPELLERPMNEEVEF